MSKSNVLGGVNLNLLVALDVLLDERAVGRSAARLGVTQSAMSHSLRQLRALFDDPLLVRVGQTMVPTPRAEELMPSLRTALSALEGVVSGPEELRPAEIEKTFTVAAHDATTYLLAPGLAARMRRRAPNASVSVVMPGSDLVEGLSTGRIDVAIIPPIEAPSGLQTTPILSGPFVVVCRRDHPDIGDTIDLDTFCRLPHALMSITGRGPGMVDHILKSMGRRRFVALRIPYALVFPRVIINTDLIATMAQGLAEELEDRWPLRHVPAPIEMPTGPMLLAWHARYDAVPENRWLRALVREVIDEEMVRIG